MFSAGCGAHCGILSNIIDENNAFLLIINDKKYIFLSNIIDKVISLQS
jgi:hypothetical protein